MKYSVIIPIYNNLQYTVQCLESIEKNCDKRETEIILINNGSTDNTHAYLQSWKKHSGFRTRVVTFPENRGFAVACNAGLKRANGKYLVLLNNDCIVTPNWLEWLSQAIESERAYSTEYGKYYKLENIGLAGPVTNHAAGMQQLKELQNISKEHIEKYALIHHQKSRDLCFEAGFLSFFCVMLRREMVEQVGLLSEDFGIGGFEDNEYILRAQEKGWNAIIVSDVFIYHEGGKTINRYFPELRQGLANQKRFLETQPQKDPILAVCTKGQNWIDIFVDDTLITRCEQDSNELEINFMNRFLEKLRQYKIDWFLILLEGEALEPAGKQKINRIIRHPWRFAKQYACHIYEMINENRFIRERKAEKFTQFRISKVEANMRYRVADYEGKTSLVPYLPQENRYISSIRIMRQSKQISDAIVSTARWHDKNSVTACILTHNEEDDLFLLLNELFPFARICLVDTSENDKRKNWIREIADLYQATLIYHGKLTDFSKARNKAIKAVNTRWILMMDPDETFEDRHSDLIEIRRMMDANLYGWCFPIVNLEKGGQYQITEVVRLFRKIPELYYSGKVHEGLDRSRRLAEEKGLKITWGQSPVRIIHKGFLKDDSTMQQKYEFYDRLLDEELEENPDNAVALFAKAMNYLNDGNEEKGREFLERAAMTSKRFYNPRLELAFYHLRLARRWLEYTYDCLPEHHNLRQIVQAMISWLKRNAGERRLIGKAKSELGPGEWRI